MMPPNELITNGIITLAQFTLETDSPSETGYSSETGYPSGINSVFRRVSHANSSDEYSSENTSDRRVFRRRIRLGRVIRL